VEEAINNEEIESFIQVYHDVMKRLEADSEYFFDSEYFHQFLDNFSFESKLLLAKIGNEIVGGAIFTFVNSIMQYHLSGESIDYKNLSSIKLIIDEARLMGCDHNMKYLHLGGGLKGSSEDSLFHFKRGFSDSLFDFKGWQLIVDQSNYSYLIDFFGIDERQKADFFPVYRAH
jgi:lipid II:glycine glycyltransferase (peptidoglycan interpeptide bridge formation enzyme)